LGSYNTRLDRLEQQLFDLVATDPMNQTFHSQRASVIRKKIGQIRKNKNSTAGFIGIIFTFLIAALISSIAVLGMKDFDSLLGSRVSTLGVSLFLWAVIFIAAMVVYMSKEQEENEELEMFVAEKGAGPEA
jgi:Na+/H+ antiporter NhaC